MMWSHLPCKVEECEVVLDTYDSRTAPTGDNGTILSRCQDKHNVSDAR